MAPRPKPRAYGTGSVYQLANGRWAATLDVGYVDGKRRRKLLRGATAEDALRKLNAALRDRAAGELVSGARVTLGQLLDRWLETVQRPHVEPSTYVRERTIIEAHWKPAFGARALAQIRPEDLQAYYARKRLAPATLRLHHSVLHAALATAVRWRLLARNPADAITLPKRPKRKYRILDLDAACRFLDQIRDDRWEALYVLAITTGARIGELLALEWEDLDDLKTQTPCVHIRRKVLYLNRELIRGDPKTDAGERTFELLPIAVDALRRHRGRQDAERALRPAWAEPALVFTTHQGTVQRANSITSYYLPRALARAGALPMTFHEFRHSFGTVLLKNREDPAVVSRLLGHSSVRVTMEIYRHVLEGETGEALRRFGALLEATQARQAAEANGYPNGDHEKEDAGDSAAGRQQQAP